MPYYTENEVLLMRRTEALQHTQHGLAMARAKGDEAEIAAWEIELVRALRYVANSQGIVRNERDERARRANAWRPAPLRFV